MKQERESLELELTLLFQRIKAKGLIKDANFNFTTDLKNYINEARIIQFVNRNLPLNVASVSELYNLARVAKFYYGLDNIILEDYFTDTEMTLAIEDKIETLYKDGIVTFENVIYNGDELNPEWSFYLSRIKSAQLVNSGRTTYNMQTQRAGKFYKVGNDVVVIPDTDDEKIKSIKSDILSNKFKINTITLNVLRNNKELSGLIYNSNERTLTIDTNIMELDIIDGAHRMFACGDAYLENPNIKGIFIINIKNLTIQQAKDFIVQESKANSHNKEDIELYDNTNAYTIFIRDLDIYGNRDINIFFNNINITNDKDEFIIYDKLIKEMLVMTNWKSIIQSKDIKEVDKALNFIIRFFTNTYKLLENEIYFKDESFIMGLFISAYKMYSELGFVDLEKIEQMIVQIEKLGLGELSFDIPIKSNQEKKIIKMYENIII